MELSEALRALAPLVASLSIIGALALSFTRCAVGHVGVVLAAKLYSRSRVVQHEKREEWLQILEEMKASERPAHAGTLLWAGFVQFARRVCEHGPVERALYASSVVRLDRVIDGRRMQEAGLHGTPPLGRYRRVFMNAFRKHTHDRELMNVAADLLANSAPPAATGLTLQQVLERDRVRADAALAIAKRIAPSSRSRSMTSTLM